MALPVDHYLHPLPQPHHGTGEKGKGILPKPASQLPKKKKAVQHDLYWRTWCKVVGYLDLALIILIIPMCIYCFTVSSHDPLTPPPPKGGHKHISEVKPSGIGIEEQKNAEKVLLLHNGSTQCDSVFSTEIKRVGLAFMAVLTTTSIGVFAAIKLICATDAGRHPIKALALARFWKHVNLIFLGFGLIIMFYAPSFIACGINLMTQLILILIVCFYIQELEDFILVTSISIIENPIEIKLPQPEKLPTVSVIMEQEIQK